MLVCTIVQQYLFVILNMPLICVSKENVRIAWTFININMCYNQTKPDVLQNCSKKKPKKTFFYSQIFLASNFLLLATLKNISKFNVLHEIRMNLAFKAINYKMFKLFVVHELWQPFLNIKSKNVMWLSLEMRCW